MALVPTGLITSRAQQEHGYRALAACVHPVSAIRNMLHDCNHFV